MDIVWQTMIAALVGGVVSLVAGVLLLARRLPLRTVEVWAVPFAAGALLAASFLDLLPEAFHAVDNSAIVAGGVIGGFLFFFLLERFFGWFHHHHQHGPNAPFHPRAGLVVIGDTLHNFLDGLVIGAAFLVDPATGWVVTLAVAAHEIPQEIGDFGLLLALGVRRRTVLFVNILSAFATVVAAVLVVLVGGMLVSAEPVILAVAAGFFIYIAAADIIPTIHAETKIATANIQTIMLLVGVVAVGGMIQVTHEYIESAQSEHAIEQICHDNRQEEREYTDVKPSC